MTPTRDEIDAAILRGELWKHHNGMPAGAIGSVLELTAMLRALRDQREADARDAARYRVIREELNDNVEFLRSSDDPEAIDEICDEIIQSAMSAQGEK